MTVAIFVGSGGDEKMEKGSTQKCCMAHQVFGMNPRKDGDLPEGLQ